jgi:hypothetical protein
VVVSNVALAGTPYGGGHKKYSGGSPTRHQPQTPAARGGARRESVLGRRFVCGGGHSPGISDLEENVRRILEFCGLEFEPACVEFYKPERSISTASSEQVRQSIFRGGLFQWRNYKRWLGPLKDSLDDGLIRYRE